MKNIIIKNKHKMMRKSRERKLREFLAFIGSNKNINILDVGAADEEYSPYDNYLEKHYPCPENITALSIYSLEMFKKRYPEVNTVTYQGGRFPFGDKEFDAVYSNAVIEHVGDYASQKKFLEETIRSGKKVYLTTPNKYFLVEPHTNVLLLHWLPKRLFDAYLKVIKKSWATGDYMNLLSYRNLEKMKNDIQARKFEIKRHKLLGLTLHFTLFIEN